MPFDQKQVLQCLDEIERELFKAAEDVDCQRFHKDTRLTAVILLLLRAQSLLRSLLLLFESSNFDGFDAVLRAFEETWNLAHEFRLEADQAKVTKWLAGQKGTWSAKIPKLVEFALGRGNAGANLGHDYG
jgi:hypothetical protein